jgi:hypothetical protein
MRQMSGRSGSKAKRSWLPAQILVFGGRTTRSSLITAVGTESTPITILTGTIRFMIVWATRAAMIRRNRATTFSMAATQPARRSAMMEVQTRSEWRQAQGGSGAVTWTRATARRLATSSAWNFSWRPTHSIAHQTKATRPKHLISQSTPGAAPCRRVALPAVSYKPLLKRRKLLVSKWW